MEPAGTSHKCAPAVISARTTDPWTVVFTALVVIQGRRDRQRARKARPRRVDPDASGSL